MDSFSACVLHVNTLASWSFEFCHHKRRWWWYFNYSLGTCFFHFISALCPLPFVADTDEEKLVLLIMYFFPLPHFILRKPYFARSVIRCDKKWVKKLPTCFECRKSNGNEKQTLSILDGLFFAAILRGCMHTVNDSIDFYIPKRWQESDKIFAAKVTQWHFMPFF